MGSGAECMKRLIPPGTRMDEATFNEGEGLASVLVKARLDSPWGGVEAQIL